MEVESSKVQYATRRRAAFSISFCEGKKYSSSGGEYGTGVSSAPTMRTGASSHSNASSWMIAARLSPMPPVRESSWTMRTLMAAAGQREDRGAIERRQRAQVEDARLDAVGGQRVGDAQRDVHVRAVRDDRQVVARSAKRRLAERQRRGGCGREHLFDRADRDRARCARSTAPDRDRRRRPPSTRGHRAALMARRSSGPASDRTRLRCSASDTGPAWRRPPHGIRTTIGTAPPQRYRIFAALFTS